MLPLAAEQAWVMRSDTVRCDANNFTSRMVVWCGKAAALGVCSLGTTFHGASRIE